MNFGDLQDVATVILDDQSVHNDLTVKIEVEKLEQKDSDASKVRDSTPNKTSTNSLFCIQGTKNIYDLAVIRCTF